MATPGEKLVEWRKARGLSQGAAGQLLDPPVTQGAWQSWESNSKPPSLENALNLQELTEGRIPARAWVAAKKRIKRRRRDEAPAHRKEG